jgi:hypothetical protein
MVGMGCCTAAATAVLVLAHVLVARPPAQARSVFF